MGRRRSEKEPVMFGKVFEQMYTGSMVGAGLNVYSLWPYMIACCDSEGDVDVHPVAVAAILGAKVDDIKGALDYLLAPDEHSRSEEHDGARIVKVLENRYHLVNYEKYRSIRDQDVRREQIREAQRRFRAKKGLKPVIRNHDVSQGNPGVSHGNPPVNLRKPRAEGREKRLQTPSGDGGAACRIYAEEAKKAGIVAVLQPPDTGCLGTVYRELKDEAKYRDVCAAYFKLKDTFITGNGFAGRHLPGKLQAILNSGQRVLLTISDDENARRAAAAKGMA